MKLYRHNYSDAIYKIYSQNVWFIVAIRCTTFKQQQLLCSKTQLSYGNIQLYFCFHKQFSFNLASSIVCVFNFQYYVSLDHDHGTLKIEMKKEAGF